jgi:hypothetical protein
MFGPRKTFMVGEFRSIKLIPVPTASTFRGLGRRPGTAMYNVGGDA